MSIIVIIYHTKYHTFDDFGTYAVYDQLLVLRCLTVYSIYLLGTRYASLVIPTRLFNSALVFSI